MLEVRGHLFDISKPRAEAFFQALREGFSLTKAAHLVDISPETARSLFWAARQTVPEDW